MTWQMRLFASIVRFMKKTIAIAVMLFSITACSKPAPKDAIIAKDLMVHDYALRTPLGAVPNTAAYVSVTNKGKTDDTLLAARCDCAEEAQLHSMRMENGMMMMQEIKEGMPLKAGQTIVLKPGSDHIMLLGLKTPMVEGQKQTVTLTFAKAGDVVVSMPISSEPLGDTVSKTDHAHH